MRNRKVREKGGGKAVGEDYVPENETCALCGNSCRQDPEFG